MTSIPPKKIPLRRLVLGAWLVGAMVHLLAFIMSNKPGQGQEWYATPHSYRVVVFVLTHFPLWVAALCILATVASKIHRAHS